MAKEPKHIVKFREKKLQPEEAIFDFCEGYIGELMGKGRTFTGCLIVTDKKVAFYSSGFFSEVYEEVPFNKISSTQIKKVLMHRTLSIHTSGNTLEFKTSDEKVDSIRSAIEELRSKAHAIKIEVSPIEQIKQLSDLASQGIITKQEFEDKKQALLQKI